MALREDMPASIADRATALCQIAEYYLATSNTGARSLDGPGRCELVLHVNANEAHRDRQIEGSPRC